jgi:hypothetical protein
VITAGTGRPRPTPEAVDTAFEARQKTKSPIVEAIRGTDRTFYDPLTDQEYLTKQEALGFPARLTKEDMINLEKENIKGKTGVEQQRIAGEATKGAAGIRGKALVEAAKVRPTPGATDKYIEGSDGVMRNQRTGQALADESGGKMIERAWGSGGDEEVTANKVLGVLDILTDEEQLAYFRELKKSDAGLTRLRILQKYDNTRQGK